MIAKLDHWRPPCYNACIVRALGVDPGEKRIGLAVSDDGGVLALPLRTLPAVPDAKANAANIAGVAREEECVVIVLGLPMRLDGSEGAAARKVRVLCKALRSLTDAEVVLWDERLTTAEAHRALQRAKVGARKEKSVIDQAAATLLLQSYLDAKAPPRWIDPEMHLAPLEGENDRSGRARERRKRRDD